MFLHTFLCAGVVPFATAAVVAIAVAQFGAVPRVYWLLGTALGFVAGYIALKNQSGIVPAIASITRPQTAADWLPIIVLLALGVGLLLAQSAPRWIGIGLAGLLALAVPLRLLCTNARLTSEWTATEKLACVCLLASAFGAIWLTLARNENARTAKTQLLLLLIDATGIAAALTISGVLVYGQACGSLAAALAGTALASAFVHWQNRNSVDEAHDASEAFGWSSGFPAAAGVITFSLGGFIILGHFFADLSATSALLLFVSLAAAGGPLFEGLLRRAAWQHAVIRTLACLVPLGVAVKLSFG
ncbi:MAG TPA: hypothetical protein VH107_04640 [Lacipirellulaceae bacterium]|jgi:hypothetical protein|nr:hypothetical protein [Lacipirellulaceae bacterium]